MEACLHFRGAALNASEAGISRATKDEGRDQREEVCDEGVGLWGESQVSNDFPKIVDKIPDDRGWNRGKPGGWLKCWSRYLRWPTTDLH